VASDGTVSRKVDALAADAAAVLKAIDWARTAARARLWAATGERAPRPFRAEAKSEIGS
jgi:hypothetical protein